jgi:hypothetical protein
VFNQLAGTDVVRQLLGFTVNEQFHGTAFYRKSCNGGDSVDK